MTGSTSLAPSAGLADHTAHRRHRAAFDASPDGIIVTDDSGLILEANDTMELLLGRPLEQILGHYMSEFIADNLAAQEAALTARQAARASLERVHAGIHRVRQADGSEVLTDVWSQRTWSEPAEYTIFLVDVTEIDQERSTQKAAADRYRTLADHVESSRQWLRLLTDNLSTAVLLEDQQRRLLVTNQEFLRMFGVGLSPDELVGADCSAGVEEVSLLFADPAGFERGVQQRVADGVEVRGERVALASGETLERDYIPVASPDGPVGHLWRYRNITQHLRETQLLADQNRSLEELARLRNEFMARVSHELRSPLTSVVSFAELLGDASAGLSPEQTEFLGIIDRNAQRLLRLIDDLLLMAKLESNTLSLSTGLIDISSIVEQTVAELAIHATAKDITLTVTAAPGPRLRADALRVQQVVSNLVRNAIAYTPPGGEVQVLLAPQASPQQWRLQVIDTGVGIPEGDIDRLCVPFFRSHTGVATMSRGTGLGLAIVKLIVDAHHGQIEFASDVGHGTTVTVCLPIEEE
ncbi:MAG: ATP-binding protein [Arachnia sp.]